MRAQLQSPDFRNVCFPCSNCSSFLHVIEEKHWMSESPCASNRSSSASNSSPADTLSMDSSNKSETERRMSLNIEHVEPSVLSVGSKAQLRRSNSSISRGRPRRHTLQAMSVLNSPTEEWSETFIAQDGVLTTNFCSTELWLRIQHENDRWWQKATERIFGLTICAKG